MRTIPAGALDRSRHIGVLASHSGAPDPREIVDLPSDSLTFVLICWADGTTTSVRKDADITIHDEPRGGQT